MATIFEDYTAKFAGSRELWERARKIIPSGINHDARFINPFPLYMDHAQGCRKWDIEGHEFIDLCTGHGSLILGHGHPAILKALNEAVGKFTHPSAPTPYEVRWAELVISMVPCAEMVRFQLSGTEATMLAMRLARAHTGRDIVVNIRSHFHGWHDYAMVEYMPPYEIPSSTGVPKAVAAAMRAVPLNDLAAMEAALAPRDVAAVILEPDGPNAGTVPVRPGYLQALRDLTRKYGTVLIFDEVITGFRFAPGGAQEYYGVTPDLSTFAKAVCGGVPGGAVAGRAEIMGHMAFRPDDPDYNRMKRVRHQGTFSANPLTAAVGVAALEILKDGSMQNQAAKMADRLKDGFNNALREADAAGCLYGTRSTVRLIVGDDLPKIYDPIEFSMTVNDQRLLQNVKQPLLKALQCAQLLEGVDILGCTHGWTSGVMTERDIDEAVLRWERALHRVIAGGYLSGKAKVFATA
jgi:glutamate-1-semialdehyde 2,1-aminomutase